MGKLKYTDGTKKLKQPVAVNNPNDKRLQMYNDSLFLYNNGKKLADFASRLITPKVRESKPGSPIYEKAAKTWVDKLNTNTLPFDRLTNNNGQQPRRTGEITYGSNGEFSAFQFAKPKQSVIYKAPIKDTRTTTPQELQTKQTSQIQSQEIEKQTPTLQSVRTQSIPKPLKKVEKQLRPKGLKVERVGWLQTKHKRFNKLAN